MPTVTDAVNREDRYVSSLDKAITSSNILLLGPRRSGKTSLLTSFAQQKSRVKEAVIAYVALQRVSTSPENFAQEFISSICAFFLNSKTSVKDISYLNSISPSLKSPSAQDIIQKVDNELQKIKPDQKALVEWAFAFPEKLASETGKKLFLILDDIENLLQLNNFPQIKNIFSLISFKSKNVKYIASSSSQKELKDFKTIQILPLTESDVEKLCKTHSVKFTKALGKEILSRTSGHPFVVEEIIKGMKNASLKRSIVLNFTDKNSPLYAHLESSFSNSMNRARGQALLKTILNTLASSEPLTLTEVSRKIYRSAPVTKSILERLIEVDLVEKRDSKFMFSDPALKLWLNLALSNPSELGEVNLTTLEAML